MKIINQIQIDECKLDAGHFNRCQHTFLELEPGQWQTISVKLPNGKHVTFAFVPGTDPEDFECVDLHTTAGPRVPRKDNPSSPGYLQHLIGFTVGHNTFSTREQEEPTTLATLLLRSGHYEDPKTKQQARALVTPPKTPSAKAIKRATDRAVHKVVQDASKKLGLPIT